MGSIVGIYGDHAARASGGSADAMAAVSVTAEAITTAATGGKGSVTAPAVVSGGHRRPCGAMVHNRSADTDTWVKFAPATDPNPSLTAGVLPGGHLILARQSLFLANVPEGTVIHHIDAA